MRVYLVYSILLLLLIGQLPMATAQEKQGQARIDSLLNQLKKVKEDTGKVNLLNNLSTAYGYINPEEGIKQAMKHCHFPQNWIGKKERLGQ